MQGRYVLLLSGILIQADTECLSGAKQLGDKAGASVGLLTLLPVLIQALTTTL